MTACLPAYGPDNFTLAPWAVVASLPFARGIVLPTQDYCANQAKWIAFNEYGFKAAFKPSHSGEPVNLHGGWLSPWQLGLNQGPI